MVPYPSPRPQVIVSASDSEKFIKSTITLLTLELQIDFNLDKKVSLFHFFINKFFQVFKDYLTYNLIKFHRLFYKYIYLKNLKKKFASMVKIILIIAIEPNGT